MCYLYYYFLFVAFFVIFFLLFKFFLYINFFVKWNHGNRVVKVVEFRSKRGWVGVFVYFLYCSFKRTIFYMYVYLFSLFFVYIIVFFPSTLTTLLFCLLFNVAETLLLEERRDREKITVVYFSFIINKVAVWNKAARCGFLMIF